MVAQALVLPFKPFTLDEVVKITGVLPSGLDVWVRDLHTMALRTGEDGFTVGLEYGQVFAVFCGVKWLYEGADVQRASNVVRYLAGCGPEYINANLAQGNTFPCPIEQIPVSERKELKPECGGIMVPAPDSTIGRRLNLRTLLVEFEERVRSVFPKGDA